MFDWGQISKDDCDLAKGLIRSWDREPDLVICDDDGSPYLYRWWITPHARECNSYFHIQVASDPARPLHDHPWDNQSVILSGGYFEQLNKFPDYPGSKAMVYRRAKGMTIAREARWAHRLILPENVPYTMTKFDSGPKINDWGFWIGGKHISFKDVTIQTEDGRSLWSGPNIEVYNGPIRF